ncbi:LANO_0D04610g1_1 [Lachancea nothofagi CBS 11611]|uniref:LANO_0D04610g1_1 n=1 Tax=Lachancea nothofagi CBS 11611 TaxID=1266666 RepID=A0A1G4JGB9_9SACH|nr:LANO_0D04610g1_1 [Lachancea nothofagi CBS 11611]
MQFHVPFLSLWLWGTVAWANKVAISDEDYQVCSGMYSRDDWSGKIDPYISFNLKDISDTDGLSVVIFEFKDYEHLGVDVDSTKIYICDDYAIVSGACNETNKNEYIVQNVIIDPITNENETLSASVMTFYQTETGLHDAKYPVKNTGYYCVVATTSQSDSNAKFSAVVNFRNAFGQLPAAEINNLPLYGLMAIFYVVAMALYSFAFWKHKNELLPLQKYLLAFFAFLTVEQIFIWAYYDIKNEKGNTAGTKVYMVFVSILTSVKTSFSFFLLLVIALGYGVVYPKLNKKLMRRCQLFAIVNFVISVAYLIQNYLTNPETVTLWPLATLVPLALTMLGFYFWILRSMSQTLRYLQEQRQVVKLKMYKRLLSTIYFSLFVLFAGIVLSSIVFIGMNSIEMVEQHWRTRFFFVDFWPSLVYYFVFVIVAFIWRPTDTSYMLACSQQLPTDPENVADFDLDDLQSLEGPSAHIDDDLNFSDDEEPPRRNSSSQRPDKKP